MLIASLVATFLVATPAPLGDPAITKLVEKMRQPLPPPPAAKLEKIVSKLKRAVTNSETEDILNILSPMEPNEFMATLSALEAKPWKGNLSLFDKFIRRGVDDRASFLAEFAEQLNNKLELGFTPLSALYAQRLEKLGHKGSAASRNRQATRRSNRDMVKASKDLYSYLGLKDRVGVRRALEKGTQGLKALGIGVAALITAPIWIPIVIIFDGWNPVG